MTHRLRLVGAFAITAALLLGACGTSSGNDADKKSDDTSTEATDTNSDGTNTDEPTTSSDTNDEAQARADAVDLTVSDFPDGWEANPPEPDDPNNPLSTCDPSFDDANDTSIATHETDQFSIGSLDSGNGAQFSAETKVFESADDATTAVDPFTDQDVIDCIDETLKGLFGDGQGATVSGQLTHDSGDIGADQAERLVADYTINADDGSSADVSIGIIAIRTDDIATLVTAMAVGDAIQDVELGDQIKKIVALQKG